MQIFLFFALLIAGLGVVFALQNTTAVTVNFLVWTYHGSLALVLLIALSAGALISLLASLPALIHDKWAIRAHRKRQGELETSLTDHRQRLEESERKLNELRNPQPAAPPASDKLE